MRRGVRVVGAARVAALLGIAALAWPARAAAEGERVILDEELALVVPLSEAELDRFYPGGTVSVATLFSVTKYLAPLARVRAGLLAAGELAGDAFGGLGRMASVELGLRFRPRGIAHPEEPSRASCIWAEIDAGVGMWNAAIEPFFEAAIGFGFLVDDVTAGPVVRFLHVLPTASADGSDAFLLTLGVELLLHDAR